MALPMMKTPVYNITVPSSKKQVNFRPFLVKEEKALLIAQESEDTKVMVETLKSIILSCIQGDINPNELAIFDYEYLFTQIRAKSVGEIAELVFLCDTCNDEKARVIKQIDISKSEVVVPEKHIKKIDLFDDVGVMMKYPNLDTLQKIEKMQKGDINIIFDLVGDCIEYIYNSTEVFHIKEQSKEDITKFLENLTQEQFGKLEAFFNHMPKLSQKVEYDCPVCNKHHDKVLEGINYFF
jgi:Zn finger protein HypA/HybF involved in hydrogenase expression